MTLSIPVTEGLLEAGLDPDDTERVVRGALAEDLRYGPDVTSAATATAGARAVAGVVAREPGVLAGLPVALAVLDAAGVPPEAAEPRHADGDRVAAGGGFRLDPQLAAPEEDEQTPLGTGMLHRDSHELLDQLAKDHLDGECL